MDINTVISTLASCLFYVRSRHLSIRRAFALVCKELSCKSDMFDREQLFNLTKEFISSYYYLKCLFEKCGKQTPSNRALAKLFLYLHLEKNNERSPRRLKKLIHRDINIRSLEIIQDEFSCYYSLPNWLVKRLAQFFPSSELTKLLNSLNKKTTWLRINTLKIDIDKALKNLEASGVEYASYNDIPFLVRVLESKKPVRTMKLFKEGAIIPQDKASVLVVLALEPEPYTTIYDFAAAPGVKASLIMQLTENKSRIIAVDNSPQRLERMKMLLKYLGVDTARVMLVLGDGRTMSLRERGDIALVDAPCSSSGALSKNPAIKIFLENENIVYYMKRLQISILNNALKYVDKAVYATCSLLPDEGEEVIMEVMKNNDYYRLAIPRIKALSGYSRYPIWDKVKRTFPHIDESEGFFIARLER
ncbi:MAG: RsmB/NOP family class I SAM-dependent RNA methyltransferase [Desulfurococcaceae archaeon]